MADIKDRARETSYHYGQINTPFQKRDQAWDFCIGNFRNLAYKWRVASLLLLLLNTILVVIFFSILSGPGQKIWLVQSNKSGFVERSGWLNLNTVVAKDVKESINQYFKGSMN